MVEWSITRRGSHAVSDVVGSAVTKGANSELDRGGIYQYSHPESTEWCPRSGVWKWVGLCRGGGRDGGTRQWAERRDSTWSRKGLVGKVGRRSWEMQKMKEMTARNARGNGGNCVSTLTRPVEWLDARDLVGRPGKLPLSGRREMRNLVGMRLRPEEDALTRLLPCVMG